MTTCKRLTIFEGPDGSGKTTAAEAFAERTGASYVHFGPEPDLTDDLAYTYAQAMLTALLGHRDLVFDRSWVSEPIYGKAFRGGADRVGQTRRAMLEALACRCSTIILVCRPPFDVAFYNFRQRSEAGGEYLKTETQFGQVYDMYQKPLRTELPVLSYDYTSSPMLTDDTIDGYRTQPSRVLTMRVGDITFFKELLS